MRIPGFFPSMWQQMLAQSASMGIQARLEFAATAGLAAAALVSAGLVAMGAGRPDEPKPAMNAEGAAKAPSAGKANPSPQPATAGPIEVRGRVVDPDGKPVTGATVRTGWRWNDKEDHPEPDATSGPDGRFRLWLSRPRRDIRML